MRSTEQERLVEWTDELAKLYDREPRVVVAWLGTALFKRVSVVVSAQLLDELEGVVDLLGRERGE